jgi:glycosyltransferase involved in cell wall biosynthesis
MKVSVLMLAYNHEQFIAQALDSVLMQQVDFNYEVVIGEDCSTDNTREILIRYQQEYPDKIRLLLPDKNLGMHDNFIQTFKACRGDYIALLEGDDYWTSPYKLQKQVDLLDAHADYTICFHSALVLYQDGSTEWCFPPENQEKKVFTLENVLSFYNIMQTASIMFRQGFIHEFPDWIYDVDFVDWILQILLAQHGNIGYIDETMSVYRIQPQGNWSRKSRLESMLETTKMFQYISKYLDLDSKHQKKVTVSLSVQMRELAIAHMGNGDRKNARFYMNIWLFKYLLTNNILIDRNYLKGSAILAVRIYIPILYKVLKRFKQFSGSRVLRTFDNAW